MSGLLVLAAITGSRGICMLMDLLAFEKVRAKVEIIS